MMALMSTFEFAGGQPAAEGLTIILELQCTDRLPDYGEH